MGNESKNSYFLVNHVYIGSDIKEIADSDCIEITTRPVVDKDENVSAFHEFITDGPCTPYGDFTTYAHGVYGSVTEAKEAMKSIFGDVRDCDMNGRKFSSDDDSVIEVYKPGRLHKLNAEQTEEYCYEYMTENISAETSDLDLSKIVTQCEKDVKKEGFQLYDLEQIFTDFRNELRD